MKKEYLDKVIDEIRDLKVNELIDVEIQERIITLKCIIDDYMKMMPKNKKILKLK